MIEKRYKNDYDGEFVIIKTTFKDGKKEQEREWIDNPIENTSLNNRACCIDDGHSIQKFPMTRLENHRGGLLSRDKMQLYSSQEIWKKMKADFTIITTQSQLDEIMKENYQVDNIVYTSARLCIENPGDFYLIPHCVTLSPAAATVWLACFDGHKDIYLFGYDSHSEDGTPQDKLIFAIKNIMETYGDVNFHHVSNTKSPDAWRRCVNLDRLDVNQFVSECDI